MIDFMGKTRVTQDLIGLWCLDETLFGLIYFYKGIHLVWYHTLGEQIGCQFLAKEPELCSIFQCIRIVRNINQDSSKEFSISKLLSNIITINRQWVGESLAPMDHFPHYVTPPQKFGYHFVNLAKGRQKLYLNLLRLWWNPYSILLIHM